MNRLILFLFCATGLFLVGCDTENVQTTESGYNYITCVDLEGDPGAAGDWVFIHSVGYAGDSIIFDSRSEGDPTPIQLPMPDAPRGQLSPLQDVLATMSIGDSVQFEYPIDSFKMGRPPFPSDVDVLTYHIRVMDIMNPQQFQTWRSNEMKKSQERLTEVQAEVEQIYADYKAGNLNIQRTESGLGYVIHKQGSGDTPKTGEIVDAQYYGMLDSNGEMFDNSFQRGQPFSFQLGMQMVIAGWDEGFGLLNPGTKATLFIPSQLGYGERGSPPVIPANADLIFYVELESVR